MADEILRTILQLEGEDTLRIATDLIQKERKAFQDLREQLELGVVSQQHYDAQAKVLAASLNAQATAAGAAKAKLNELAKAGAKADPQANARKMNYRAQQFAYLVDDLQYVGEQGLRPILNNLTMINPLLGVMAIAFNKLWDAAGGWEGIVAKGGTETEAQRMERLEKVLHRTGEEQRQLNQLKREHAAIQSASGPGDDAAKATSAAADAVRNAGGVDRAGGGMANARGGLPAALDPDQKHQMELREAHDRSRQAGTLGDLNLKNLWEGEFREVGRQIYDDFSEIFTRLGVISGQSVAERDAASKQGITGEAEGQRAAADKKRLAQALADPGGEIMKGLIKEARANPKAYAPGFADSLEAATPAAIRGKAEDKSVTRAIVAREMGRMQQEREEESRLVASQRERYHGEAAAGQAPGEDLMALRLRDQGKTEEEARTIAESVLKELDKGFKEELRQRIGKTGRSEAEVRAEMAAEHADRPGSAQATKGARPLQAQYDAETAAGREPGRDEVAKRLRAGGMGADDAERVAGDALKELRKGFKEEVGQRAGATGRSEAEVRADMARDFDERRQDEAERRASHAKDRREGRESKAAGDAEEAMPGVASRAETAYLVALMAGKTRDEAKARVAAQVDRALDGSNLTDEQQREAGAGIARGVDRKVEASLVDAELNPVQKKSEVVGAADFASKVQSAGSDRLGKDQLMTQKGMLDHLAEIRRLIGPALNRPAVLR